MECTEKKKKRKETYWVVGASRVRSAEVQPQEAPSSTSRLHRREERSRAHAGSWKITRRSGDAARCWLGELNPLLQDKKPLTRKKKKSPSIEEDNKDDFSAPASSRHGACEAFGLSFSGDWEEFWEMRTSVCYRGWWWWWWWCPTMSAGWL